MATEEDAHAVWIRTLLAGLRDGTVEFDAQRFSPEAYQLFLDKEVGSIEVGKAADLIVLSENPRKVDPEKISGIKVLATYVNGKEYWREGM